METLIAALHICLCFFLVIVVLLQPGKGGDVSAAFGGGGSQTVFGARGATTFLQKMTTYCAGLFMVTTISLAWYSNADLHGQSVIDAATLKEFDADPEAAPAVPAPADPAPADPLGAAPAAGDPAAAVPVEAPPVDPAAAGPEVAPGAVLEAAPPGLEVVPSAPVPSGLRVPMPSSAGGLPPATAPIGTQPLVPAQGESAAPKPVPGN